MTAQACIRRYQQQAVQTSSPEQIIAKLYDLGVAACHAGDRVKVRKVLVELMAGLNFELGGEIAVRLQAIYEFCLEESNNGQLDTVRELLEGLREAWREGVLGRKAA